MRLTKQRWDTLLHAMCYWETMLEEGEEIRVGEVFMEAIGELAFAPVETILAQAGTRFADYKNMQQQAINDQRERFTNFVTVSAHLSVLIYA